MRGKIYLDPNIQALYTVTKEIQDKSRTKIEEERAFLTWWIQTQHPDSRSIITDGKGDGQIDAVITNPDNSYTLIQSKYWEKFHSAKTISKLQKEKDQSFLKAAKLSKEQKEEFENYLKIEKISVSNKEIYKNMLFV